MEGKDRLLDLLVDFFNLPPGTKRQDIVQSSLASWDSLAMVQLIAELQGAFSVEFDIDEIQALRSYDEIRHALGKRGISLNDAGA
jgi:acyl carrier protein